MMFRELKPMVSRAYLETTWPQPHHSISNLEASSEQVKTCSTQGSPFIPGFKTLGFLAVLIKFDIFFDKFRNPDARDSTSA